MNSFDTEVMKCEDDADNEHNSDINSEYGFVKDNFPNHKPYDEKIEENSHQKLNINYQNTVKLTEILNTKKGIEINAENNSIRVDKQEEEKLRISIPEENVNKSELNNNYANEKNIGPRQISNYLIKREQPSSKVKKEKTIENSDKVQNKIVLTEVNERREKINEERKENSFF
jgi:hypothetical protein